MHIRNSAKAIIISENKLLLTKNIDEEGYFYVFPGGGQEHGETLHDAVKRECVEEIGKRVSVGELLHIREYIGKNHEYAADHDHVHQVEYYFVCSIEDKITEAPTNPDSHQVGLEWVSMENIEHMRIYPNELKKHLINFFHHKKSPVYLGDVN